MSALIGTTFQSLARPNNLKFLIQIMGNKFLMQPKAICNSNDLPQKRYKSSCRGADDCSPKEEDPCFRLPCKSRNREVCVETELTNEDDYNEPPGVEECMFNDPDCCLEQCPDANLRLDCLYYRPSNKNRCYQQTWVSCPPARKVPKVVCCNPLVDRDPPLPRRERCDDPPPTACSMGMQDRELMKCQKDVECMKLRLACCREARDPPSCKRDRYPRNCEKIRCPYPSFSECSKPWPVKGKPTECNCLELKSLCELFDIAKRKGMIIENKNKSLFKMKI